MTKEQEHVADSAQCWPSVRAVLCKSTSPLVSEQRNLLRPQSRSTRVHNTGERESDLCCLCKDPSCRGTAMASVDGVSTRPITRLLEVKGEYSYSTRRCC